MTKNREEKKKQLERDKEDLMAFDGNEKEIAKIDKKLHEIEIEEEFEDYKKHRMEYLRIKAEHKKAMVFINQKGLNAEWNRFSYKEDKQC